MIAMLTINQMIIENLIGSFVDIFILFICFFNVL